MNHHMISMYIDDELTLDDKIEFVETIHGSKQFTEETVELLQQEKLLRSDTVECFPERELAINRPRVLRFLRPFGLAAAAVAATLIIVLFPFTSHPPPRYVLSFCFLSPGRQSCRYHGEFYRLERRAHEKGGR